MMNKLIWATLLGGIIASSCVTPPDYDDGLLENIPAVVNDEDFFSLSILGDEYSKEEEWPLFFSLEMTDTLLMTLMVKNLDVNASDSSVIFIQNNNGDRVFEAPLLSNLIWNEEVPIVSLGQPKSVHFLGENFSGNVDFQILRK